MWNFLAMSLCYPGHVDIAARYVLKTPGLGEVSMSVARLADTSGQPAFIN